MKRLILLFFVAFLIAVQFLSYAANITYNGKSYWINGINVPWNNFGNDVGGNGYDSLWFESLFTQCQASGINCVRLWIHCSGWKTPNFDGSGFVTGIQPNFLTEMDDICKRADNHKVMVMPCLWSFDMTASGTNGTGLIKDSSKTRSYINNCLIPLVKHCANTPNLIAWEISNEPEWSVVDQAKVTKTELQRFCGMIAAAIHTNCGKMVTVGSACLKWNSNISPAEENWWSDAALKSAYNSPEAHLDFYQIHYYDWMVGVGWAYDPFDSTRNVSYWSLDKPVLVGECPAADNGRHTMKNMLANAFSNNYAGVMFWSYNSDWGSNWTSTRSELKTFHDSHAAIIDYGATATTYTLTLTNGTGSGNYAAGTVVSVFANDPATGMMFDKWTGNTTGIGNINSSSTTLVMPSSNATLTATYKTATYTLTVTGGAGSGSYSAGTVINISANAPVTGKIFDKWSGATTGIANINSASTTITMPSANIIVTATYKNLADLTDNDITEITFYPNPVNNVITITQPGTVSIYDLNGILQIKKVLINDQAQIDVGNLHNGMYIIKISNDKGTKAGMFIKE